MPVSFTTTGGQLVNTAGLDNPKEVFAFAYQISAESELGGTDFEYTIDSGVFPGGLTLNLTTGAISGNVAEMNTWVPGFSKPDGYKIAKDGSNYKIASVLAGEYLAEFTVKALEKTNSEEATQDCSILVINNYSSDRDQFIRDYDEHYGPQFKIDDSFVSAEEYLQKKKAEGLFPPE